LSPGARFSTGLGTRCLLGLLGAYGNGDNATLSDSHDQTSGEAETCGKIIRKKTGRSVPFEITPHAQAASPSEPATELGQQLSLAANCRTADQSLIVVIL